MERSFWDERYAAGLVYGEAANEFLVSVMSGRRVPEGGRALDIGAGEGRNALYLASLGYEVLAIDQSTVGMEKAARRARERGLGGAEVLNPESWVPSQKKRGGGGEFWAEAKLRAMAVDLREFDAPAGSFDVVSSIFVHLPRELRAAVHGRVKQWLRPGGIFVLEAYAPEQIARGTGGPKDPALLAGLDVILGELEGLEIVRAERLVRVVVEGVGHTGEAEVVEVVGRKS